MNRALLFLLMLCLSLTPYVSASDASMHWQADAASAPAADETPSDNESPGGHHCKLCALSAQFACAMPSALRTAPPPQRGRQLRAACASHSCDQRCVPAFQSRAPPYR